MACSHSRLERSHGIRWNMGNVPGGGPRKRVEERTCPKWLFLMTAAEVDAEKKTLAQVVCAFVPERSQSLSCL